MYRTTLTVTTLAIALVLASTVSTGSLAVAGSSVSTLSSATSGSSTAPEGSAGDPQVDVSTGGPTPHATQLAPSAESAPESSPVDIERASVSATTQTATAPAQARPQPTTPAAPLAAQPAPFGTPTQTPSTPACATPISGSTAGAPSRTSPLGVAGTTSGDLQAFAVSYNAIRVANCLQPVPFANIRYDSCMEDRLFWMAEDPSSDPLSAWGHIGTQRSDGVPSVGCDGNLAGGLGNDGAIVAQKWWDSTGHRTSLYKPTFTGSTASVCILFAMTHGGVPDEPYSFTRSAARWVDC